MGLYFWSTNSIKRSLKLGVLIKRSPNNGLLIFLKKKVRKFEEEKVLRATLTVSFILNEG